MFTSVRYELLLGSSALALLAAVGAASAQQVAQQAPATPPGATPIPQITVTAPKQTQRRTTTAQRRTSQTRAQPAAAPLTPLAPLPVEVSGKSKVVAGLLGIFLVWCGAHRFYLGYPGIGILIILSNICCGIGVVWGFVEGILCLAGVLRDSEGRPLRD